MTVGATVRSVWHKPLTWGFVEPPERIELSTFSLPIFLGRSWPFKCGPALDPPDGRYAMN